PEGAQLSLQLLRCSALPDARAGRGSARTVGSAPQHCVSTTSERPQYASSNSDSVSVELYEPGATPSGVCSVRAAVAVRPPLAPPASAESSARGSSSCPSRPTLFGTPGVVLSSREVGTSSPGATSPLPSVIRLGAQPRWSAVIGSWPSEPVNSLACPVT